MDMQELGEMIRKKRRDRRMTQAELATEVGISRYTLMQLESGHIPELGIRKVLSILGALALEMNVREAQTRRPTLDEMYALRDEEDAEQAKRYQRPRERI